MGKFDLSEIKKQPKQDLFKPDPKPEQKQEAAPKQNVTKGGRPKKEKDERLSKKVSVNFTEAEFEKLLDMSKQNFGVPLPRLIRNLLKQDKHI